MNQVPYSASLQQKRPPQLFSSWKLWNLEALNVKNIFRNEFQAEYAENFDSGGKFYCVYLQYIL